MKQKIIDATKEINTINKVMDWKWRNIIIRSTNLTNTDKAEIFVMKEKNEEAVNHLEWAETNKMSFKVSGLSEECEESLIIFNR